VTATGELAWRKLGQLARVTGSLGRAAPTTSQVSDAGWTRAAGDGQASTSSSIPSGLRPTVVSGLSCVGGAARLLDGPLGL